jgi:hypothetical protein
MLIRFAGDDPGRVSIPKDTDHLQQCDSEHHSSPGTLTTHMVSRGEEGKNVKKLERTDLEDTGKDN